MNNFTFKHYLHINFLFDHPAILPPSPPLVFSKTMCNVTNTIKVLKGSLYIKRCLFNLLKLRRNQSGVNPPPPFLFFPSVQLLFQLLIKGSSKQLKTELFRFKSVTFNILIQGITTLPTQYAIKQIVNKAKWLLGSLKTNSNDRNGQKLTRLR